MTTGIILRGGNELSAASWPDSSLVGAMDHPCSEKSRCEELLRGPPRHFAVLQSELGSRKRRPQIIPAEVNPNADV